MFYLRIDSECMHRESSSNICVWFENTLVLDGDPEIRGEQSYCSPDRVIVVINLSLEEPSLRETSRKITVLVTVSVKMTHKFN